MNPSLVVGYHASSASLRALGVAKELGGHLGADIHVVHVVDLGDYPVDPDRGDWEAKGEEKLEAEEETIAAAMAAYSGHWEYHLLHGSPAHALCQLADKVDAHMIVLGTRGLEAHH
jgi:nucleotide-binding universal stress UspA family protein